MHGVSSFRPPETAEGFRFSANRKRFARRSPSRIGRIAADAMRAELETTPKPGLVDQRDCGAHCDMDRALFGVSIDAIIPYLLRMAHAAKGRRPAPGLFGDLRRIGREAEDAMFRATGGVNTHKGQIFVLALLIAAVSSRASGDPSDVRKAVKRMTRGIVDRELVRSLRCRAPMTHGENLFLRYGATGVRGEAEAGFPAIFEIGLPVYCRLLSAGVSRNDAAAETLLHIMSRLEDTTVLHRGGKDALDFVRSASLLALSRGGLRTLSGRRSIGELNRQLIRRGISPGGSADLLAGTIFFYRTAGFLPCPILEGI